MALMDVTPAQLATYLKQQKENEKRAMIKYE